MAANQNRELHDSKRAAAHYRENVSFAAAGAEIWKHPSLLFYLRNVRLVTACILVAIGLAVIYLCSATRVYTAHAELLYETKAPEFLHEQASQPEPSIDSPLLESQIVLLKSELVATSVIKQLNLLQDQEFQKKSGLFGWLFGSQDDEEKKMRNAIEEFSKRLDVRRIGISNAIEVAFSSQDSSKAASIANGVMNAYLKALVDFRSAAARAASKWLEQGLSQLRIKMNDANARAERYKAAQDYRIARPAPSTNGDGKTDAADASPGQERATLDELELTAQTYQKVYQDFFSAFTNTVQRESYPVSNVQIISTALVPDRPSSPKIWLVLAIAVLFGVFVGSSAAFAREGLKSRFWFPTVATS